jgi:hypothetical protein
VLINLIWHPVCGKTSPCRLLDPGTCPSATKERSSTDSNRDLLEANWRTFWDVD